MWDKWFAMKPSFCGYIVREKGNKGVIYGQIERPQSCHSAYPRSIGTYLTVQFKHRTFYTVALYL